MRTSYESKIEPKNRTLKENKEAASPLAFNEGGNLDLSAFEKRWLSPEGIEAAKAAELNSGEWPRGRREICQRGLEAVTQHQRKGEAAMSNIVPFPSPSEIAARVAVGGMPESSIPGSAKWRSLSAIESGGDYMSGDLLRHVREMEKRGGSAA